MSVLMEFIAGDARQIGAAIDRGDDLRSGFVGHVDFSLHLTEEALDALVEEVCACKQRPAMTFREVLTEHVAGEADGNYAADVVAPSMVETLASLSDFEVRSVARTWTEALDTTPSPELIDALSGLRDLCVTARARSAPVVFSWSL